MTTPKEQALEFYTWFYNNLEHTFSEEYSHLEKTMCKMLATKAVEWIMESNSDFAFSGNMWGPNGSLSYEDSENFWRDVIKELYLI
jgi:hypothetical protein